MEQFMKVNGGTIKLKDREHSGMLKEISTPVSSKLIRPTVKESTRMLTDPDTKANGSTTSKREKVRKPGLMEPNMLVSIKTE
jgi:hypothetical protein